MAEGTNLVGTKSLEVVARRMSEEVRPSRHAYEGMILQPPATVDPIPTYHDIIAEGTGSVTRYDRAELVELYRPHRSEPWYEGTRLAASGIAYFVDEENDQIRPYRENPYDNASVKPGRIRMVCAFRDFAIAPTIELSVQLARTSVKDNSDSALDQHKIIARWSLSKGIIEPKTQQLVSCIDARTFQASWHEREAPKALDSNTADKDDDALPRLYVELEFESRYVVWENFSVPESFVLNQEEKSILDTLASLRNEDMNAPTKVKLRIYLFEDQAKDYANAKPQLMPSLKRIMEQIPKSYTPEIASSQAFREHPFYGHRSGSAVHTDFRQMLSRRDIILSGAPFVALRPISRFLDQTHAQTALGSGTYLEWQEKKQRLQAVSNDEHICTIHLLDGIVIVGIRWHVKPKHGLEGDKCSLPPDTKVTLAIRTRRTRSGVENVRGTIIERDLDTSPAAHQHVLVTGEQAELIADCGSTGLKPADPQVYVVNVKPKLNETTVDRSTKAVRNAYDAAHPGGSQGSLLSLVLYDGTYQKPYNPWAAVPDQAKVKEAYQDLCHSVDWDESQRRVLEASTRMTRRTLLVTAPAGSGKTKLLVHKGRAATQCSGQDKVLFVSDSNAAVDNMVEMFVRDFPNDTPPVRIYARLGDAFDMAPDDEQPINTEELARMSEEELAILTVLQHKKKSRAKGRRSVSGHSVEDTILRYIDEGRVSVWNMYDKDGNPDPAWDHGDIDMFDFLHQMLQRLWKSEAKGGKTAREMAMFSDDEERWFTRAYEHCRRIVIQNASIVASTVVNCASDDMKHYFASGPQDRVWIEVDEATSIQESAMLIPLAGAWEWYGRKIVSLCMYGDLKQPGPVIIGVDPQSGLPAYNEFGSQIRLSLFHRLIECGFPFIHLQSQCRMHLEIFDLANHFFYKEQPTSRTEDLQLPHEFTAMLPETFNLDPGSSLSEFQKRVHYFEVPGIDQAQVSNDTGSRANLANVKCVMALVKGVLHKVYGKEMQSNVAVITPYSRQRSLYATEFHRLRDEEWSTEEIPMLLTVDSAVGREFSHVILDYTVSRNSSKGLGFMRDQRRACMMHTRGRRVLWIVGSDFEEPKWSDPALTLRPRLRQGGKDESKGKTKGKNSSRLDVAGARVPKVAMLYYRKRCEDAKALSTLPKCDFHPLDWPMDFWSVQMTEALHTLYPDIAGNRMGQVELSAEMKERVMDEATRRKEVAGEIGGDAREDVE